MRVVVDVLNREMKWNKLVGLLVNGIALSNLLKHTFIPLCVYSNVQ
jgi:hypothetical protein